MAGRFSQMELTVDGGSTTQPGCSQRDMTDLCDLYDQRPVMYFSRFLKN